MYEGMGLSQRRVSPIHLPRPFTTTMLLLHELGYKPQYTHFTPSQPSYALLSC